VRRLALLALTIAIAPVAAACGGSTAKVSVQSTAGASTTTASTTVSAVATTGPDTTTKQATTLDEAKASLAESGLVTTAQAGCVVDGMAASIGADAAITVANLDDLSTATTAQQDAVVTAFEKCVPKSVFGKSIADDMVSSATQQGVTISAEQSACVADKVMDVVTVRNLLIDLGSSGMTSLAADKQAGIASALAACLPADVLTKLNGG
jgi:hypothetical protein